jgi:hypothetical protein
MYPHVFNQYLYISLCNLLINFHTEKFYFSHSLKHRWLLANHNSTFHIHWIIGEGCRPIKFCFLPSLNHRRCKFCFLHSLNHRRWLQYKFYFSHSLNMNVKSRIFIGQQPSPMIQWMWKVELWLANRHFLWFNECEK